MKDGESLMTDVCLNAILRTKCLKHVFPFPFPNESNLILSTSFLSQEKQLFQENKYNLPL